MSDVEIKIYVLPRRKYIHIEFGTRILGLSATALGVCVCVCVCANAAVIEIISSIASRASIFDISDFCRQFRSV